MPLTAPAALPEVSGPVLPDAPLAAQAAAADPGVLGAWAAGRSDACAAGPEQSACARAPAGNAPACNPLLRAAAPLLRALAAIQCADKAPAGDLRLLRDRLAQEVLEFSRGCDRLRLREEHMLAARYALCTALDEALSCKPWAGGEHGSVGPWSQYALLQEFHHEGEGGRTVFVLIARLAAQPQEHREVLELMLHILALGFMGDYRQRVDGRLELDRMRRRLLALVGDDGGPIDLAPHAQRESRPARRRRLDDWWYLAPALALVALLGSAWLWGHDLASRVQGLREDLLSVAGSIDASLPWRPALPERRPGSPSLAPVDGPDSRSAARAPGDAPTT